MDTVKINLEKGQTYIGVKGLGQVQRDLSEVVARLLHGEITIVPQDVLTSESITFRCGEVELELLHQLATRNNISLQKLLRTGLEQSNLVAHQKL